MSDTRHQKGEKGCCLAGGYVFFLVEDQNKQKQNSSFCLDYWKILHEMLLYIEMFNTLLYVVLRNEALVLLFYMHYCTPCYLLSLNFTVDLGFFLSVDPRIEKRELGHMDELRCYNFNK